ncbi:MAG: hypothetical protein V1799_02470 [bacterium]
MRQKSEVVGSISILIFFFLFYTTVSKSQTQNDPYSKYFWVEKISKDGSILLREYRYGSTSTLSFPDIELWQNKLGIQDPLRLLWSKEPDLRLTLLSLGYAKLRNKDSAPSEYLKAQNDAIAQHVGMWAEQSNPEPPDINWGEFLKSFLAILGALVTLLGIPEIIKLIRAWRKRRRLDLVFLGRRSTGKTWIWNKLVDRDISLIELEKIESNIISKRKTSPTRMPMGDFVVVPIYIDTPGGNVGEQVNVMMEDKRRFQWLYNIVAPKKSVWIILLSTTEDRRVTKDSNHEIKYDQDFIEQQFGSLDLPIGILSSRRGIKPEMVILCISKFDLYASHCDPLDNETLESQKELSKVFLRHIERVKSECENKHVPYKLIFCSALRYWNIDEINHLIKITLFQ